MQAGFSVCGVITLLTASCAHKAPSPKADVAHHVSFVPSFVVQQPDVSKPTATRYPGELEKGGQLVQTTTRGASTEYRRIGS
jgi:hypothetical protein